MSLALLVLLAAAEPNPIVAQAQRSYAAGEYLAAAKLLERVLASGIEDRGKRAKARLYLAASSFAIGDRDACVRALALIFGEQPDFAVDAQLFPPPFMRVVEQARAEAKKPPPVEPRPVEPAQPPQVRKLHRRRRCSIFVVIFG